jgi:HlyD family secretion protein
MTLTTDQVTNFTVKIRIDRDSYKDLVTKNKRFAFRPGMSASVDVNTSSLNDIVTVPIQAVTTREKDDDEKTGNDDDDVMEVVFVTSADTVAMKQVKTGIQDDTYIQILSGLDGGEEVVTGPYSAISKKMESGKEIEVVEKDDKKKKGWSK